LLCGKLGYKTNFIARLFIAFLTEKCFGEDKGKDFPHVIETSGKQDVNLINVIINEHLR